MNLASGPQASIPFSLHPDYDRRPRNHTGSADLAAKGAKRSRAMHIARNYRRWGIAPRPENVAARTLAAESFYHIFPNGA